MPKMQVKNAARKKRWPNVLVGGLLRTIGTRSQQHKKEEEIQRKANLKLCKALKSQPRIDVLVGGSTIKVKPFSKRHADALKRLAESEHEPIKSDGIIYTGKRKSRR